MLMLSNANVPNVCALCTFTLQLIFYTLYCVQYLHKKVNIFVQCGLLCIEEIDNTLLNRQSNTESKE